MRIFHPWNQLCFSVKRYLEYRENRPSIQGNRPTIARIPEPIWWTVAHVTCSSVVPVDRR